VVIEADAAHYGISSGAACSSRSSEPSHVLTALGMPPEWLRGTVRISFGRFNSPEAARGLGSALRKSVNALRDLR
jgi:cysteine desulfurase